MLARALNRSRRENCMLGWIGAFILKSWMQRSGMLFGLKMSAPWVYGTIARACCLLHSCQASNKGRSVGSPQVKKDFGFEER